MCSAGLSFGSSSSVATHKKTCGWAARLSTTACHIGNRSGVAPLGGLVQAQNLFACDPTKVLAQDASRRRIRASVGLSACPTVTMLERIEPVNRVLHSPA